MLWLLLSHPLALLAYWLHPRVWVWLDVKRFQQNGSKDSLLRTFHRQRASWRIGIAVVIALLASLPAWGHWLAFVLSAVGLLTIATAYWYFDFNPRLNVARNLPYVGEWHVTWNPAGAYFPDQYIWQRAWEQVRRPDESETPPPFEDLRVVAVAGPLLRKLLHNMLVNGAVAYSITILLLIWVS